MRILETIQLMLGAILLLMLFTTIYFAKDVVLPIALGLLLSLTLSPLVRGARRLGISPPLSAFVIIFLISAVIGVSVYFLGGIIADWIKEAPQFGAELRYKLSSLTRSMDAMQDASAQVEEIAGAGGKNVPKVAVAQPGLLSNALSSVASFGTSLAVALILALLILASGDLFNAKLVSALPTLKDKKRALGIVFDIERRISRYLLSLTIINAGLGLAVGIALYLLGVPYSYVWGVGAFLFNFLPFLGAIVGAALVGAYAVITFDSLPYAATVPLTYLVLSSIEGQLITPYLLGRRMELNTVSVFLTVIFWAWLWGVPGALMAVPFLVVLKVICENFEGLSVIGNFLSAREQPAKDASSEKIATAD